MNSEGDELLRSLLVHQVETTDSVDVDPILPKAAWEQVLARGAEVGGAGAEPEGGSREEDEVETSISSRIRRGELTPFEAAAEALRNPIAEYEPDEANSAAENSVEVRKRSRSSREPSPQAEEDLVSIRAGKRRATTNLTGCSSNGAKETRRDREESTVVPRPSGKRKIVSMPAVVATHVPNDEQPSATSTSISMEGEVEFGQSNNSLLTAMDIEEAAAGSPPPPITSNNVNVRENITVLEDSEEGEDQTTDAASSPLSVRGWTCDRCTLHNDDQVASCEACGARRRRQKAKKVVGASDSEEIDEKNSAKVVSKSRKSTRSTARRRPSTQTNGDANVDESVSRSEATSQQPPQRRKRRLRRAEDSSSSKEKPSRSKRVAAESKDASGSEFSLASDNDNDEKDYQSEDSDGLYSGAAQKIRGARGGSNKIGTNSEYLDDLNDSAYDARMEALRDEEQEQENSEERSPENSEEEKDPDRPEDTVIEGGLRVPGRIASRLFQYQMTGIRWMWQLRQQGAGGIVGDEMGLGKTVQVSAYIGALHASGHLRTALIVAPATVIVHWCRELRVWAPKVRVALLHKSGPAFCAAAGTAGGAEKIARRALKLKPASVIVTSYEGLKSLKGVLMTHKWDLAVLDEGQRIRNPDADVTLLCKQLCTAARLILTGTPIQNSLVELWSLFDFVFPGRLGTLPAFEAEFAEPIRIGAYANASRMQVQLAYRCAVVLRGLIEPYLLRRQKRDVRATIKLPKKTEHVLFCRLTSRQRALYQSILASPVVDRVVNRRASKGRYLQTINFLRKLCNHPDLLCPPGADARDVGAALLRDGGDAFDVDTESEDENGDSLGGNDGGASRSGKLLVLQHLLPLWKKAGHRVLVFTQTRRMLTIIEKWVKAQGWRYGRLDGSTPVSSRQSLIDRFNTDSTVFIFLLTTRTGGVGTNLVGADRVVLFDPDWNPSTDAQARERAWRVGQKKPVTVYRLITAGTIEEKVYHRQIFKTSMSNDILKGPKQNQKRLFSSTGLRDLFALTDDGKTDGFTNTTDAFEGRGVVAGPGAPAVHEERERGTQNDNEGSDMLVGEEVLHDREPDGDEETGEVRGGSSSTNSGAFRGQARGSEADRASSSSDAGVLKALFDGSPLTCVFSQDLAEGRGRSGAAGAEIIRCEREAARAAEAALEKLRQSRRAITASTRGQGSTFLPTWTGRSGVAGAPGSQQPRFGSGSASGASSGTGSQALLARIRSRQQGLQTQTQARQTDTLFPELHNNNIQQGGNSNTSTNTNTDGSIDFYVQLLTRLENFFGAGYRGATTAAVLSAFSDVPHAEAPVFKRLLRTLADCHEGVWKAKSVTPVE